MNPSTPGMLWIFSKIHYGLGVLATYFSKWKIGLAQSHRGVQSRDDLPTRSIAIAGVV